MGLAVLALATSTRTHKVLHTLSKHLVIYGARYWESREDYDKILLLEALSRWEEHLFPIFGLNHFFLYILFLLLDFNHCDGRISIIFLSPETSIDNENNILFLKALKKL